MISCSRRYGAASSRHPAWKRRDSSVRADGKIVGGAQLIVRRFGVLGAMAYVPYGPVVAVDVPQAATPFLANRLRHYCAQSAIRGLFRTAAGSW